MPTEGQVVAAYRDGGCPRCPGHEWDDDHGQATRAEAEAAGLRPTDVPWAMYCYGQPKARQEAP